MSELRGRGSGRSRGYLRGRGRGGRGGRAYRGSMPVNAASSFTNTMVRDVSTEYDPSGAPGTSDKPRKPQKPPRPPFEGPLYDWSLATPRPKLRYLTTCEDADSAIQELVAKKVPAVGFDIEWRPQFLPKQPENPVALVQLASEYAIYLFQITSMRGAALIQVISCAL